MIAIHDKGMYLMGLFNNFSMKDMSDCTKNHFIEFNPYLRLNSLTLCKDDTCFSVMKHLFPYFMLNASVGSFNHMLESIVTYVKRSHIPEDQIDTELDHVVSALYTPYESSDTVTMFIDHRGKLMAVNSAFEKVYKYKKEQVTNKYVGKYTRTVWFDRFLDKPQNFEAPKYFPGNHTNNIRCSDGAQGIISGNTWPLIDSNGKFYGAVSVHRRLCG